MSALEATSDEATNEATSKKKGLKPADIGAAKRAYAIYLAMHDKSIEAIKDFQKKYPKETVPDTVEAIEAFQKKHPEETDLNTIKVTQTYIADRVGWTQGNLSQYLTGAVPIREKALQKLCQALDCNPWDIRPEYLSDTDLLEHNQKLAERVNKAEDLSRALTKQLGGILASLSKIEGSNEVVDRILADNNAKRNAA